MKRRLTTILSADVAGYSRLMGRDEEGTHARLTALFRELLEPALAAHGGTLIKRTGDGLLAEFPSVVEAVRCAAEIQAGVGRHNAGLPLDAHARFRIGINLGDVIAEDGDIFGEGVNIAVRLEGLADPGGIVISDTVREHVRGKLLLGFEDMGEQRVRNIARPVHAFRVRAAAERGGFPRRRFWRVAAGAVAAAGAAAVTEGAVWWRAHPSSLPLLTAELGSGSSSASEPTPGFSIVVLPFANLSGDAQQDYFVDGVTESLTTDLSRVLPGSFVVARRTALTYRGRDADPGEIGRDLNVRYLLQGSVMSDGGRVRVNARLIDGKDDSELWAERFDAERRDVLDIQDHIVGRLSRAVGLQLVDIEARRSARERPRNPTAVDLVMRGQSIVNRPASPETMSAGRALFQQALKHDPGNVDALAGVATTYVFEVLNSYYEDGRAERLRKAADLLQRALAIDPDHIVALKIRAALLRAEGQFEEAIAASKVVIAQNPGEPWAYKEVGLSELYLGRFQEALTWFERADQLGPRDPARWNWLGAEGRVQFFLGRDEEAIRLLKLTAEANPKDIRAYALLAAIYALAGRREEADAALASCLRLRPDITVDKLFDDWSVPLQATSPLYQSQHERFRDGLILAGMTEC